MKDAFHQGLVIVTVQYITIPSLLNKSIYEFSVSVLTIIGP